MTGSAGDHSIAAEQRRLTRAALREQADLRRHRPWLFWSTLLGPPLVTVALLVAVGVLQGWAALQRLAATAAAGFFLFGKFLILAGRNPELSEIQSAYSPGELFLLVLYMDVATALLLVFHIGLFLRLPWLGPRVAALVEDGRYILATRPWMRRATFAATMAFVTFPLAATGSVGGSVFGRLLGLSRLATFSAIALGSLVGCALMYFGAGLLDEVLDRDDPWVTIGGVVFVAALLLWINLRYRHAKRRMLGGGPQG